MSVRVIQILGENVEVNDAHENGVLFTTAKKYPELHNVEGKGFSLNKEHQICLKCDKLFYKAALNILEKTIYEIEVKLMTVEETIKEEPKKEVKKYDSKDKSLASGIKSKRTSKRDNSGDDSRNKED